VFQTYGEECVTTFFIRCADVGLNCDCIIYGDSEIKAVNSTIVHMYEYHAINPEEMTTCMNLKIRENIHTYTSD
jgi:predicted small metal-binding protein